MLSNQVVIFAIGAACASAAAGGGYLATRHNDAVPVAPAAATINADPTFAEPAETVTAERAAGEAPRIVTRSSAVTAQPIQTTRTFAPSRPATRPEPRVAVTTRRSEPAVENQAVPSPAVRTSAAETTPARAEPVFQAPAPAAEATAQATSGWDPPTVNERPAFREFVVAAESVVGIEMESTISSESAKIEDRVEARVVRDVRVDGEVAIPAGSRTIGSVSAVERGGKFKERASLGIRFHTLVLADGTEIPISTETIYRYGDAPGKSSVTKVGSGAAAGAILGAILGGSKGAVIGASTGAGAGAAVVVAGDRSEATFTSGTELTARILAPVTVTVGR